MNVLSEQGIDYVPIVINSKVREDKSIVDFDFSMDSKNKLNAGLCVNCDINTQCMWQRNNKMFCEHYH